MTAEFSNQSIGSVLYDIRCARRLTMREVQTCCGISTGYLSQIEQGKRAYPNLRTLQKLARTYGLSLAQLVTALDTAGEERLTTERLTPGLAYMAGLYERLTPECRHKLSDYGQYLLSRQNWRGQEEAGRA